MSGLGREIKPAETVGWSWQNVLSRLPGLKNGLLVGLSMTVIAAAIFSATSALFYGVVFGSVSGLIISMVVAVASLFIGVLNSSWSGDLLEGRLLLLPNGGIFTLLNFGAFLQLVSMKREKPCVLDQCRVHDPDGCAIFEQGDLLFPVSRVKSSLLIEPRCFLQILAAVKHLAPSPDLIGWRDQVPRDAQRDRSKQAERNSAPP